LCVRDYRHLLLVVVYPWTLGLFPLNKQNFYYYNNYAAETANRAEVLHFAISTAYGRVRSSLYL